MAGFYRAGMTAKENYMLKIRFVCSYTFVLRTHFMK